METQNLLTDALTSKNQVLMIKSLNENVSYDYDDGNDFNLNGDDKNDQISYKDFQYTDFTCWEKAPTNFGGVQLKLKKMAANSTRPEGGGGARAMFLGVHSTPSRRASVSFSPMTHPPRPLMLHPYIHSGTLDPLSQLSQRSPKKDILKLILLGQADNFKLIGVW